MRPDKIEEEDKHADEIVGRIKGAKALFGFVPGFELMVESLDEVVGDIIMKGLDPDVDSRGEDRTDGDFVSTVAVRDNSPGNTQRAS